MNLSITDVETTSVTLEWDPATDADDQTIVRQRDWDGEWGPEETIADLKGDGDEYVDDDVQPGTTYRYQVVADLEDGTIETSDWTIAETVSLGLGRRRVPPRGWYVEVDHKSGATLTPQILGDVQWLPQLNDQPEARIPVPREDAYLLESFEEAAMRVWKDGVRQPVDELEDVDISPDRCNLIGIGGTDLERRTQEDVGDEPVPDLVERLIDTHTDLVANVDEPASEVVEDVVIALATDQVDLEELIDDWPFDDDVPLEIEDGEIRPLQTCFVLEGQDFTAIGTTDDDRYSGGKAASISTSIRSSPSFDLEYDIPEAELYIREGLFEDAPSIEFSINGMSVSRPDGTNTAINWATERFFEGLDAGSHFVEVDADDAENDFVFDLIAVADDRYDYDLDNDVDENLALEGPQLYPDELTIETETLPQFRRVLAATLDIDANADLPKLELSNDNGVTWVGEDDTGTLEATFDEASPYPRARITIGHTQDEDSGDATPTTGDVPMVISSIEIRVDADDVPLVLNQRFDDDLVDVLQRIAKNSNAVFEVRRDGDEQTLEWSWPGLRDCEDEADVVTYTVTKHNRRVLEATVKGGNAPVRGESLEANVGSPVSMSETGVTPGSEIVRDPDSGERFRPDLDYVIRGNAGEFVAREAGRIEDGQTVELDYEYQVSGTYTHPDYDGDPRESIAESIPELASERACEQVAMVLVDELSEPLWEADVEIPAGEDISLIEALDLEDVPGEGMSVYEIDETPEALSLRLGSRNRVRDTVEQIRSTLQAASDRV